MAERVINIDTDIDFAVDEAKKLFFNGKVFIYPTDTIYGFGANPFNREAVDRITAIKKRDIKKAFILLVAGVPALLRYTDVENEAHIDFLNSIWPNPISVVMNLNAEAARLLNQATCAFRVPYHQFCHKLLEQSGMPLISTSVNRSDEPPLNDPEMIISSFGKKVDTVFYTERKPLNLASTVVDLTNSKPKLIRDGKYRFEEIMDKYHQITGTA